MLPSAGSGSISTDPPDPSMLPTGLASMVADRIEVQPFIMLLAPFGFAAPFLAGLVAGRARSCWPASRTCRAPARWS